MGFAQWLTYSHCLAVVGHFGWHTTQSLYYQRNYIFPSFTIPLDYFLFNLFMGFEIKELL